LNDGNIVGISEDSQHETATSTFKWRETPQNGAERLARDATEGEEQIAYGI